MIKTLLVDGDNLLKISYFAVKELYYEGKHIGGIFQFINTLRRFILENDYDKVIVFWDGDDNSAQRKKIYPQYKQNRRRILNEHKQMSFDWQKSRIKIYLEEAFIRQINIKNTESDDLIAYYCQISEDEIKTIFSSDKDLTQLISPQVSVYSPTHKKLITDGENIIVGKFSIPHKNVVTYKIMVGDKSDNIEGIYRLGDKTLFKRFPEILENVITIDDILEKVKREITEGDKTLNDIFNGKTKTGILGPEFFERNKKLVDLTTPMIPEEGKDEVNQHYEEDLDPEGRGYKNLMKYMIQDGIFKYLPKKDDAWVEFIKPFMKLTRKEKRRYNENK